MDSSTASLLAALVMGFLTAVVSGYCGFDRSTPQHWAIFAVGFAGYIGGQLIAGG